MAHSACLCIMLNNPPFSYVCRCCCQGWPHTFRPLNDRHPPEGWHQAVRRESSQNQHTTSMCCAYAFVSIALLTSKQQGSTLLNAEHVC